MRAITLPTLDRQSFSRPLARTLGRSLLAAACAAMLFTGCGDPAPGKTFYERKIDPILKQSCAGRTSGCHVPDQSDPFKFVAGNLDMTSFETITRRRDLLEPFGAYPVPLMLIKAVGTSQDLLLFYGITLPNSVPTTDLSTLHTLEVPHSGGSVLQVGSDAYLTLLSWMENGATESGLAPERDAQEGSGPCATFIPEGFNANPALLSPAFTEFKRDVEPALSTCGAGSCHGAQLSDFYITCGDNDDQSAFNFEQVRAFVTQPIGDSPILKVPLAVNEGGYFHTGGTFFPDRDTLSYKAIETWAEKVGPKIFGADPGGAVNNGKVFFAKQVQPLLLRRGCMFEGCHSPAATNDFKLRSGSQGFFSAESLERNYEIVRDLFMAIEVPDVRRGRAVAKGLLEAFGGIPHRGGPLLETPGSGGSDPALCPQPFDHNGASALCIFQEWLRIERLAAVAEVSAFSPGTPIPMVYVQRNDPTHLARPREFDTYQPDSDLVVADTTFDTLGQFISLGTPTSILDNCPGAGDRTVVDVRSPDVHHDGNQVTFAMRTSQGDPLGVYKVNLDDRACVRLTAAQPPVAAIGIHDFDPAWSPDGNFIVFASTRRADGTPTVSRRADAAGEIQPQSDLWRIPMTGGTPGTPEQVTWLTNSELSPQMIREGRIIMTTEKVSQDFYQLAGRRINWDLTDYHPLLAQRAESPFVDPADPEAVGPSVDYAQATEIRESLNGDFLLILSDPEARGGAGTLAVFNRSIGTFEAGRMDPGYLPSMTIPVPSASGRATPDTPGATTDGAFRSPFPFPDGRVLVSFAQVTGDLAQTTSLDWDLALVDPRTGQLQLIRNTAGVQELEAVLAIKHPPRELYFNRRQLVFGGTVDPGQTGGTGFGVLHFPDAPMLFTLLNANLRRGRPVDLFREASHLAFYLEQPAPASTALGAGAIFENRTFLGRVQLAEDGSARVQVPTGDGLILELQDESGSALVTMREEHQVGPGEITSLGVKQELFDGTCGGCHGSVSGLEIDVTVSPDVLTGASESDSAESDAVAPSGG